MSSPRTLFVRVIPLAPVPSVLDYTLSEEQAKRALPGTMVEIPLREKIVEGYVLEIQEHSPVLRTKPIIRELPERPPLPRELLRLIVWISEYYCAPLFAALRVALPSVMRQEKPQKTQWCIERRQTLEALRIFCAQQRTKKPAQALIVDWVLNHPTPILLSELLQKTGASKGALEALIQEGIVNKVPLHQPGISLENAEYLLNDKKPLNDAQQSALEKIHTSLLQGTFQTHLVHGVTGSGKTEVYLQAIDLAMQMGKTALVLVPEIALTAQTIHRFKSRFRERIAVLHHRLSDRTRREEWKAIQCGQARIVIGARSAVFSPLMNLGLIIVDEEHENSYKHTHSSPCYHARDVAVMRGKLSESTVILGSATPSVESYFHARRGKYQMSALPTRAAGAALPKVSIVDMQAEYEKQRGYTLFSSLLLEGIARRLHEGEQILLFLNRRGYHTALFCSHCHSALKCHQCELPMTFHRGDNALVCHLCNHRISPPPQCCPSCAQRDSLKFKGVGTEQVERTLHALFEGIRTVRMDADTTKQHGSHARLFREFMTGKGDVLIGTQMIAKGLDFPRVTLVGILNGEMGLQIPDFRASESLFQMLTQVAGRSGRGTTPGEVVIQSSIPLHPVIQQAAAHDHVQFYENELRTRELFLLPPFAQFVKFQFHGTQESTVKECAWRVREQLLSHFSKQFVLLPVIPAGHPKVKNDYFYHFLLRTPRLGHFHRFLAQTPLKLLKGVKMLVDVNPISTFF